MNATSALRWILPEPVSPAESRVIAAELQVLPVFAELLCRRGYRTVEEAAQFLQPRLKTLSDPFLLPNMNAAVERIFAAIDRRERIVLYGDYDVDGVTSLALLCRVLQAFGNRAECFLPHRIDEGYGLSVDGVSRCLSELQPALLIAVDCGTASAAEVHELSSRGVDVIVLDHHECKATLPECVAVVNPKVGAEYRYLCSVGIAFKVAHALVKRRPVDGLDLREYLDLVALGTVADIVPIAEENRILVKRGLLQLAQSRWAGVRALLQVSGLRPPLKCHDIGFGLGPRLNAAGRLGTARDALELLLTEDSARALALAEELDRQNRDRRAVEDEVLRAAEEQLEEWFDSNRHAAIVVGAAGWHPGVVGIVASRLMKRHHRPTLVVGFDEHGNGKGSGRSIEGLSLVAALGECASLLEKFGGHVMAAGVTLSLDRLAEFRETFCKCAAALLTPEQLIPRLRVDAELSLDAMDFQLLQQHAALEPFGTANPQPVFWARSVELGNEPRVLNEKHLRLQLRQNGSARGAIWFDAGIPMLPPQPWDVAFRLEQNEWQGRISPEMRIEAVRTAS